MLKPEIIKFVQRNLKKRGWYNGTDDGDFGINSQNALARETRIPPPNKSWNLEQKIIGYVQLLCYDNHLNPKGLDGQWGTNTEKAFNMLAAVLEPLSTDPVWRPEEILPQNPNNWPLETEASLISYYGAVGDTNQLASIDLPFPMKLAWDKRKTIQRFTCHIKVGASVLRVLAKVENHYGLIKIQELGLDLWGGCFNIRPIRGGTRHSTHSWGIAIDFDPERNQLKWGRDKANFARTEYDYWWQCWEEEGWISLGRTRNFDWMHVQAARLPQV